MNMVLTAEERGAIIRCLEHLNNPAGEGTLNPDPKMLDDARRMLALLKQEFPGTKERLEALGELNTPSPSPEYGQRHYSDVIKEFDKEAHTACERICKMAEESVALMHALESPILWVEHAGREYSFRYRPGRVPDIIYRKKGSTECWCEVPGMKTPVQKLRELAADLAMDAPGLRKVLSDRVQALKGDPANLTVEGAEKLAAAYTRRKVAQLQVALKEAAPAIILAQTLNTFMWWRPTNPGERYGVRYTAKLGSHVVRSVGERVQPLTIEEAAAIPEVDALIAEIARFSTRTQEFWEQVRG